MVKIEKKKVKSTTTTFKKSLKKYYGDFRKLDIYLRVFAVILILSFLLAMAGWAILGGAFVKLFYSRFIDPLGFDTKTPFSFFLFIGLFLGIPGILIMKPLLKEKLNGYVILSFYIILFILIFGLCFINETYKPDLPNKLLWDVRNPEIHFNLSLVENYSFSTLDCHSSSGKREFVIGDKVTCKFNICENCSIKLSKMVVIRSYMNESQNIEETTPVRNAAYSSFLVDAYLREVSFLPLIEYNETILEPYATSLYLNNKYSEQDYNQKQTKESYDKTFLLITLISISFFSTIVAMNNLKQLLGKPNSERK